jgi:hypothetical protein
VAALGLTAQAQAQVVEAAASGLMALAQVFILVAGAV